MIIGGPILSSDWVRKCHRRILLCVAVVWCVALLVSIGAVVWLGDARGVPVQEMPVLGAGLRTLLFPGFHAAALFWWLPLSSLGVRPPQGQELSWSGLGGVVVVVVGATLFWLGLVPWVITTLRVYLWPGPLRPS
jgi:hypothetical protein